MCVFVCWLYESPIHVASSDRKSSCPSVTTVFACVCACVCVGGRVREKELTLSFMTVSIMLRYGSLLVLSVISVTSLERDCPIYWIVTLPCVLQRKRGWPLLLSHCLFCLLKCSRVSMKCTHTYPHFSAENPCLWEQISERLPAVTLNKCCLWLQGAAVGKGHFWMVTIKLTSYTGITLWLLWSSRTEIAIIIWRNRKLSHTAKEVSL